MYALGKCGLIASHLPIVILSRPIIAIFILFQFIVVSLKDGMFNNANVLFRTKFVDGMSTVSRTVNKVK